MNTEQRIFYVHGLRYALKIFDWQRQPYESIKARSFKEFQKRLEKHIENQEKIIYNEDEKDILPGKRV
jgi:hypothetical protein